MNGSFVLKSVSGSAIYALASPGLSDKTVRKFAELPIYCQPEKCSPGKVVSGSIRFTQIFAGVRWREGVKCLCQKRRDDIAYQPTGPGRIDGNLE